MNTRPDPPQGRELSMLCRLGVLGLLGLAHQATYRADKGGKRRGYMRLLAA